MGKEANKPKIAKIFQKHITGTIENSFSLFSIFDLNYIHKCYIFYSRKEISFFPKRTSS